MTSPAPAPSPRPPHRPRLTRAGFPVVLRHPTPADQPAFTALRNQSGAFLTRWEPRSPLSPAGIFQRLLETSNTETSQRFLLCAADTNAPMGQVSLNQIIRGPLQQCFLGYWIASAYAGRGFMNLGLQLALRHAFTTLKLHRVEANIQPDNVPSLRLVKRLGFRLEGFSPKYLQIAGRWADHERWALTREDFARVAPAWPPPTPRTRSPRPARSSRSSRPRSSSS